MIRPLVLVCLLVVGGLCAGGPASTPHRAAAAGAELFRLIRYALPGRVRFLVVVAGTVSDASFTLRDPDRLVVNLFGAAIPTRLAVAPQGGDLVDTRLPLTFAHDATLRDLRLGRRGDRARLVFDLRGPTYTSVLHPAAQALLIDLLTADSRAVLHPTPLQVVTSALLDRGTIVQRAEFGVWPVLVSGGGSSRRAVVQVAYASGKVERYVLHRDVGASGQWVVDGIVAG